MVIRARLPEEDNSLVGSHVLPMLCRRLEEYGLSHREAPASSDRAINPSLVVFRPNNRPEHLRGGVCRVRVEVHRRAKLVTHGDPYGGGLDPLSEQENTAHPFVLLEREGAMRPDHDVGPESPYVWTLRRELPDF